MRYFLILTIAVGALVAGGIWWLRRGPATPIAPPDAGDPRLTFQTPYLNVRPEVRYVGDQACADCHLDKTLSYREHPMGQSLIPVGQVAERLDASTHNPFEENGYHFLVHRQGKRFFHKEERRDGSGRVIAAIDPEVHYALGSGAHGRSYLIDHDGFLFQSPISWYSSKSRWDLSPGYRADKFADRPVTVECLACHSNHVDLVPFSINHYRQPVFQGHAIGCERCHGPGELHVQKHEAGSEVAAIDPTIVNPAHLKVELRDAVCEQCHILGEARVLRQGRELFDYRPGLPLTLFWSVFVRRPEFTDEPKAVSHVEQMHASKCYQASQGRLGCISCHDPHELPAPAERVAFYRGRCLQCHQEQSCSLPREVRRQQVRDDSCIACHMKPSSTADIAHTAATDHRIVRRESAPAAPSRRPGSPGSLMPGDSPLLDFHAQLRPQPDPEASRSLSLAMIHLARRIASAQIMLVPRALPMLDEALERWPDDVDLLEARAYARWQDSQLEPALADYEHLLKLAPDHKMALDDAATVADILGRTDESLAYRERSVAVNPWVARSRARLAAQFADRQKWTEAITECRKTLAISPALLDTRLLLISCLIRKGQRDEARAEFTILQGFDPSDKDLLHRWFDEQLQIGGNR